MRRKTLLISIALIFFTYGQILNVPLTPEDFEWISAVRDVKPSGIYKFFLPPAFGGIEPVPGRVCIIPALSFWINYQISGINPFPYRLTNILFHFANITVVFALAKLLFAKSPKKWRYVLTAGATLLFAVFPYHSETVAFTVARADLLASLFYYLSLLTSLLYFSKKKTSYLILSLSSFFFALVCKENTVTFPLVLLLFWYIFKIKISWRVFGYYLTVLLFWLGLKMAFLISANWAVPQTLTFQGHVSRVFVAYIVLLLALALYQKLAATKRLKVVWLLYLAIGATLLPTAYLPTAERYLYLPSVLVMLTIAQIILLTGDFLQSTSAKKLAFPLVCACLVLTVALEAQWLYIRNTRWVIAGNIFDRILTQTKELIGQDKIPGKLVYVSLPGDYQKAYIYHGRALNVILKNHGIYSDNIQVLTTTTGVGKVSATRKNPQTIILSSEVPFYVPESAMHSETGTVIIFSKDSYSAKIHLKDNIINPHTSLLYFDGTNLKDLTKPNTQL